MTRKSEPAANNLLLFFYFAALLQSQLPGNQKQPAGPVKCRQSTGNQFRWSYCGGRWVTCEKILTLSILWKLNKNLLRIYAIVHLILTVIAAGYSNFFYFESEYILFCNNFQIFSETFHIGILHRIFVKYPICSWTTSKYIIVKTGLTRLRLFLPSWWQLLLVNLKYSKIVQFVFSEHWNDVLKKSLC